MNVSVTAVTDDAITTVMSNLWQRGEDELNALGCSREQAAQMIASMRDQGLPTMAWRVDDLPVFICGLIPDANGARRARTWFQATEDFTQHQREITKAVRRHMEGYVAASGIEEIEIFSMCQHPRAGRWFKALGFMLDIDRHPAMGEPRTYRFVRRFPKETAHVLPEA